MERINEGATFYSKSGNSSATDSYRISTSGQHARTTQNAGEIQRMTNLYGGRGASSSPQWTEQQNFKTQIGDLFRDRSIGSLISQGIVRKPKGGSDYNDMVNSSRQRTGRKLKLDQANREAQQERIKSFFNQSRERKEMKKVAESITDEGGSLKRRLLEKLTIKLNEGDGISAAVPLVNSPSTGAKPTIIQKPSTPPVRVGRSSAAKPPRPSGSYKIKPKGPVSVPKGHQGGQGERTISPTTTVSSEETPRLARAEDLANEVGISAIAAGGRSGKLEEKLSNKIINGLKEKLLFESKKSRGRSSRRSDAIPNTTSSHRRRQTSETPSTETPSISKNKAVGLGRMAFTLTGRHIRNTITITPAEALKLKPDPSYGIPDPKPEITIEPRKPKEPVEPSYGIPDPKPEITIEPRKPVTPSIPKEPVEPSYGIPKLTPELVNSLKYVKHASDLENIKGISAITKRDVREETSFKGDDLRWEIEKRKSLIRSSGSRTSIKTKLRAKREIKKLESQIKSLG